jgi:hypothetical protein
VVREIELGAEAGYGGDGVVDCSGDRDGRGNDSESSRRLGMGSDSVPGGSGGNIRGQD